MTMVVRRCTRCGIDDLSRHWATLAEAAGKGVADVDWACPTCAWPGAELAEVADDAAREPVAAQRAAGITARLDR